MKKNTKTAALLLLGLGLTAAKAQQAITASGGVATGSGGTASFSIGQIVYTTHSNSSGSVALGVQQPYEISVLLGVENNQISLNMLAFPNPTTEFIQLKVENEKLQDLSYQLFDVNGKLIESKKMSNTLETIRMENLASAIYFLKVTNNNKLVKSFKITKN